MQPTLSHYLILSVALLTIALTGIIMNRRNVLRLLLSVELLLLSANLNFVAVSAYTSDLSGQAVTLFVLATAAAESAIGLALLIVYFRRRGNLNIGSLSELKG